MPLEIEILQLLFPNNHSFKSAKPPLFLPELPFNLSDRKTDETWILKHKVVERLNACTSKAELRRYIRSIQKTIEYYLECIFEKDQVSEKKESDINSTENEDHKSLLNILSYIETNYPHFFEADSKVPKIILTHKVHTNRIILTQPDLDNNFREPDKLILLRIEQIRAKIANIQSGNQLTYRQLRYLETFISEFYNLHHGDIESPFSVLQRLLIFVNYNDMELVWLLKDWLLHEIFEIPELNSQIDRLNFLLKSVKQIEPRQDLIFNPQVPSVKAQLCSWIVEEVAYREKKKLLSQPDYHFDCPSKRSPKFKIQCHLSVDQLGIIFRAVTDLRLITVSSQRALFEHIAPYLSTNNRTNLSPDSMRSKSYSPEKKDLESVKEILMKIFRQINKY